MKQIDYNIPIFDDNDEADLNEYSNKMAQAIKEQVDKFGNPLIFKGTVTTSQELPSDAQSGWIYNVSDENKNYIYNGTEWVVYSENIDTTLFINQSTVYYDDLDNIKDKTSYYYTSASATNKPPQANGTNGYVFTQMVNENVGYQTYKTTNAEYERFKNVTWGDWQIKNTVKITTGQEFKTGRIIDGKEEYGKRINFGALPNNTSKTISHGINFYNCTFTGMQCDFQNTSGYKISFQNYGIDPTSNSSSIIAFIGNSVASIKTSSNMSNYTGFVTICYTKN